jgi:hypothetical protein
MRSFAPSSCCRRTPARSGSATRGRFTIYSCDHDLAAVAYEDAEPVRLTESFLQGRERFLGRLLGD